MTEFTASNGMVVRLSDFSNGIQVEYDTFPQGPDAHRYIPEFAADAVREFVRHERDNELGRWRWPENPEWVIFPPVKHQGAFALNESTGERGDLARWEVELLAPHTDTLTQAIAAYFDANPEPDRPWERAEEGDVWALTFRDQESSWFVNGRYFQNTRTLTNILPSDKFITAGRRLFPEVTE